MTKDVVENRCVRLGQRLLNLRKERGLTLLGLAVRANVDDSKLAKIEKGQVNITYDTLINICQGLDMLPKDFMDFEVGTRTSAERDSRLLAKFVDSLSRIRPLAKALAEELIKAVAVRQMFPDKFQVERQEHCQCLYYVAKGKLCLESAKNRYAGPIGFVTEGHFYLEPNGFQKGRRSEVSLRAIEFSIVLCISHKELRKILRHFNGFGRVLNKLVGQGKEVAEIYATVRAAGTVDERMAAVHNGAPLWLPAIPKGFLAPYLDMALSSVVTARKKYLKNGQRVGAKLC